MRLDKKVSKNEMRMSSVQHATTLIKMQNMYKFVFLHTFMEN